MHKILILLFALLTCVPSQSAHAALDTELFGQIPILDEGRIKPIDSFARDKLKELSGHDKDATQWLMETLFDPARAEGHPTIKIVNPEIRQLLHLPIRKGRLYSYNEINKGLEPHQELILSVIQMNEEDWSTQQRDLIKLQKKIVLMRNLLGSISIVLPLSFTLPPSVDEPFKTHSEQQLSYFSTLSVQEELTQHVKDIYEKKGDDIAQYNDAEQSLAHLSFTLALLKESAQSATIFNVIQNNESEWLNPWEAKAEDLVDWHNLAQAYHAADAQKWQELIAKIHLKTTSNPTLRRNALNAEYLYNKLHPQQLSFILSLCALGFLFLRLFVQNLSFKNSSFLLLMSSLVIQISALATRIYILERPPVSTLYETILFVSVVVLLYVLSAYYKDKNITWLWMGSLLAVTLHLLGFAHNQDGDSMLMLTAVLNTNFWLTTHVLCITIGYGFCALTSILAHYTLGKMVWERSTQPDAELFKHTKLAALFALFFAGIGTVLGGIWADQSWGRFWGWDPKENGALLICLWLIWSLHGRISGQMKDRHCLYAFSFLSVILALSWFGVNLLGVGLHSYGFTDSALFEFMGFIAVEALFIVVIAFLLNKRTGVRHA